MSKPNCSKVINIEDVRMIRDLREARRIISEPPEAHSEITMILPNGMKVVIPPKNEHLLNQGDE